MTHLETNTFVHGVVAIGAILLIFACGDNSSKKTDSSDTDTSHNPEIQVGDTSENGTVLTEENATLCEVTCDQLETCDADEFSDCAEECTNMALALRQSVLDEMTECISLQDCTSLSPDKCMADAIVNVSDSVVDGMVGEICQKMNSCDPSLQLSTCEQMMTEGEEDLTFFKVFNDNVLDCFGTCVSTKTCQELDAEGDAIMEDCVASCDADMGGDDSQSSGENCEAFAGDWQTESVSCSGTDLPLGDMSIDQTIHSDCSMEMSVTNGQCIISYVGAYDVAMGSTTLRVATTCGGGCDENSCSNSSDAPSPMDISLTPGETSLTMSYNVTPEVVAANMSPCSQGSLNTTVMSAK